MAVVDGSRIEPAVLQRDHYVGLEIAGTKDRVDAGVGSGGEACPNIEGATQRDHRKRQVIPALGEQRLQQLLEIGLLPGGRDHASNGFEVGQPPG